MEVIAIEWGLGLLAEVAQVMPGEAAGSRTDFRETACWPVEDAIGS